MEDVRLRTADAHAQQCSDVAIAAMLAQQVGAVPQPRHRFGGHGQRAHGGVQGPSFGPGAGPCLDGEVAGTDHAGGIGEFAEDPTQCGDRALLARRVGGLWSDRVPDARDVTSDLAVGEVVEQRVNDRSRHVTTEGCGPSGEVGVPHVAETERHDRFGGLVGHVGDHRDGLDELEESSTHGLGHDSTVPLPTTATPPIQGAASCHARRSSRGVQRAGPSRSGRRDSNPRPPAPKSGRSPSGSVTVRAGRCR